MSRQSSHVAEAEGDLFDTPPNSVLVHACNCLGVWGAGIAKMFKENYPAAYEIYRDHCRAARDSRHSSVLGTCLLIPPSSQNVVPERPWIACLFTSIGYGKKTTRNPGMDPPKMILKNTRTALRHMKSQVESMDIRGESLQTRDTLAQNIYSCRINSGLFGVPWEGTKEIFEEVFAHKDSERYSPEWHVTILSPPEQAISSISEETLLNPSEQTLVPRLEGSRSDIQPQSERPTRQYPTRLRTDLEAFSERPRPERVTVSPPPSNSKRSISVLLCDK